MATRVAPYEVARVSRRAEGPPKVGLSRTAEGRTRLNVKPRLGPWTGEGARAGDFHIHDLGAGHVNFQRLRTRAGDFYHFQMVCDLFDDEKVKNIKTATLVLLHPDSRPRYGKSRMDEIAVPMRPFQGEALPVEARKAFGVALPTPTVRSATGLNGVSFYIKLEMADGQNHAVNLNGEQYNDFLIPHSALRGSLPAPRRPLAKRKNSPTDQA
jgi:hypothetical protein